MWGFAPRPTKNFLGRKFLDFKELVGNVLFEFLTLCAALARVRRLRGALPTGFGAMLH
jgi:hypothetical protein